MNKILEMKFGSHLYGTDTENSDLDFKGIYLPSAEEIVLGRVRKTIATSRPKKEHERNNKDDVDVEIVSLDRFIDLLLQGQTMALDMLFAPREFYSENTTDLGRSIMDILYVNRQSFLNKNINAFVGYARQQAAKYGVKGFRVAALRDILQFLNKFKDSSKLMQDNTMYELYNFVYHEPETKTKPKNENIHLINVMGKIGPELHLEVCNRKVPIHATIKYAKQVYQRIFDEYGQRALKAEKNEGVDWKALSHAVRVNAEAIELLTTSKITFPRPERELLLKIKLGQMNYKEVSAIIEKGLEDLNEAQSKSILPDKPDIAFADQFVYSIYSEIVTKQQHPFCP